MNNLLEYPSNMFYNVHRTYVWDWGMFMVQAFGGAWTLLKLEILEKYLNFYVNAMKNQRFSFCYIDAFAGSGEVDVRGFGPIPGSALRAVGYSFDRYIFIDKNQEYINLLAENIKRRKPSINADFLVGDCNELLATINSYDWYSNYWRGVIFLDPYAMSLKWSSLAAIAETHVFDVWYLFPLSAVTRLMRKDGDIIESHRQKINDVIGTDEWEQELYSESKQLTIFGEPDLERTSIDGITTYWNRRLKTIFAGVTKKPIVLRNPENNSPLFLLCFAVSNPAAIKLSLKAVDHILTHTSI